MPSGSPTTIAAAREPSASKTCCSASRQKLSARVAYSFMRETSLHAPETRRLPSNAAAMASDSSRSHGPNRRRVSESASRSRQCKGKEPEAQGGRHPRERVAGGGHEARRPADRRQQQPQTRAGGEEPKRWPANHDRQNRNGNHQGQQSNGRRRGERLEQKPGFSRGDAGGPVRHERGSKHPDRHDRGYERAEPVETQRLRGITSDRRTRARRHANG